MIHAAAAIVLIVACIAAIYAPTEAQVVGITLAGFLLLHWLFV